jgi:hypothetical protein
MRWYAIDTAKVLLMLLLLLQTLGLRVRACCTLALCSQVVLVCVHDGPSWDDPVQQRCNLAAAHREQITRGCWENIERYMTIPGDCLHKNCCH